MHDRRPGYGNTQSCAWLSRHLCTVMQCLCVLICHIEPVQLKCKAAVKPQSYTSLSHSPLVLQHSKRAAAEHRNRRFSVKWAAQSSNSETMNCTINQRPIEGEHRRPFEDTQFPHEEIGFHWRSCRADPSPSSCPTSECSTSSPLQLRSTSTGTHCSERRRYHGLLYIHIHTHIHRDVWNERICKYNTFDLPWNDLLCRVGPYSLSCCCCLLLSQQHTRPNAQSVNAQWCMCASACWLWTAQAWKWIKALAFLAAQFIRPTRNRDLDTVSNKHGLDIEGMVNRMLVP